MPRSQSDQADLLRAIQEDPMASEPRRAFGDWLERRGDALRAEAVRLGAERRGLGRSEEHAAASRRREIEERLRRLSREDSRWAGELPRLDGVGWHDRSVDGFFERILIADVESFRRQAGRIFDAQPVVSIGFLKDGRAAAPDLPALEAVFAAPEMERLGGLSTMGVQHGNVLAEAIARGEALRNLRFLRLWLEGIDDDGAAALSGAERLGTLNELDLHGNSLTSAGCRALAGSAHFTRLEDLNLADNEIDCDGADALAAASWLKRLRSLDLSNNEVGPEGAEALANCRALSHLARLDLKGNAIGARGAASILESDALSDLTHLSLTIDTPDFRARPGMGPGPLPNLRVLVLDGKLIGGAGSLGAEGLASILAPGSPSRLEVLSLFNNPLGDAGALAVAEAASLDGLKSLNLTKTGIGDAGARALAGAGHLRKLERLVLGNNAIGDAGARAIADSEALQGLRRLVLGGNRIAEAAQVVLRERFGDRVDL